MSFLFAIGTAGISQKYRTLLPWYNIKYIELY